MKKLMLIISIMLFLLLPLYADKTIAEKLVDPKKWEPNGTGQTTTSTFYVTFEGSEEGVLYSDIGFSKVPTQITTSGLNKTAFNNDSVTMEKGTSDSSGTVTSKDYSFTNTSYNYTTSVFVYWYCSFNKAKTLTLTVKPADGSTVRCVYTEYTYNASTGTSTDKKTTFVSADSGVTLATFADVIAVYHDNSQVIFNAEVKQYPTNGVIATVTLTLEDKS